MWAFSEDGSSRDSSTSCFIEFAFKEPFSRLMYWLGGNLSAIAIFKAAWVTRITEVTCGYIDSTFGMNFSQNSLHLSKSSSSSSPSSEGTTVSGSHSSDRAAKYCESTSIVAGSGMWDLLRLYHSPSPRSRFCGILNMISSFFAPLASSLPNLIPVLSASRLPSLVAYPSVRFSSFSRSWSNPSRYLLVFSLKLCSSLAEFSLMSFNSSSLSLLCTLARFFSKFSFVALILFCKSIFLVISLVSVKRSGNFFWKLLRYSLKVFQPDTVWDSMFEYTLTTWSSKLFTNSSVF
ncbi:hypothetical protein OGATHE_002064 [Ogataea polymorpha]|uniref:Uncharacterized protein n=1 Tax=Ogataea polymorpha TaxID=460523 RepID=A0A9P8PMS0_9ASCO|nr:hypothetical protein OGATHE_002064 [Ogataea polymorpha]